MSNGIITFSRVCLDLNKLDMTFFRDSEKRIRVPFIDSKNKIEDITGAVQLDFANKYLGGGVLNHGCVQEEIRFVICPELLVSMLFSECLDDNEAMLIRGCEQFSSYSGYADSFEWSGDYQDPGIRLY